MADEYVSSWAWRPHPARHDVYRLGTARRSNGKCRHNDPLHRAGHMGIFGFLMKFVITYLLEKRGRRRLSQRLVHDPR